MVLFPPGEVLPWDFFRGRRFAIMVLFPPWGSFALGFLPGKVCHMVFLHGERLLCGIISRGGGGKNSHVTPELLATRRLKTDLCEVYKYLNYMYKTE